ncbi:MAG TPA: hypothetical protein VN778_04580 [Verrucomicrobiae bacterium]|nr:hypothetical protein [Verrucomicrobiae bacterium]
MNSVSARIVLVKLLIAGDVLFILWILYNGMDSGWQATPLQLVVYIALIALLSLSSIFLYSYSKSLGIKHLDKQQ